MDNTDPYKTKFKEERLYMSTNQNLMQHAMEGMRRYYEKKEAVRSENKAVSDRP